MRKSGQKIALAVLSLGLLTARPLFSSEKDAHKLVKEMVQTAGSPAKLKALKDVEYTYTYQKRGEDQKEISLERYVFDGELSWARYPGPPEVLQGYNGHQTWATQGGRLVTDPKELKRADFLRKTNFYWFSMMQKLLDPGVHASYLGQKTKDGVEYDLVKITFGGGIGDVADTYVLYINPSSHLVDQFLFTVMDFGKRDPYLMKVVYSGVEGLKLPVTRKYIQSDWEGEIKGTVWTDELMRNIKFNNGFSKSLFEKPGL